MVKSEYELWVRSRFPKCSSFKVPLVSQFFLSCSLVKGNIQVQQLLKYLCPNNLVAIWKNNTHKLKVFYLILTTMGFVHLLGIAQLLKPWNQIGQKHPHFLFHFDFGAILAFLSQPLKNPVSQIDEISKECGATYCWNCKQPGASSSFHFVCLGNSECKISHRSPLW